MENLRYKTKKEVLRSIFDFLFTFENKKGDILDHWIAFHDAFRLSPQAFYDRLTKELAARKIPGLEVSKEEFSEGGLLSDRRIYLKLFRERLALYTCAAPFGTGYFFSCRVVHVPALVRLWHIIVALLFFGIIENLLIQPLGMSFTIIALVGLLFAIGGVFKGAAASAIGDFDAWLLKIPVVSTIYQNWFRSDDTYWRVDTRIIYVQAIPKLIRELAEEICGTNGIRLTEQYRYAPILGELYKPVPPTSKTEKP